MTAPGDDTRSSMAAFIPYDERTSLPVIGAVETDALDFKGKLNRTPDGKIHFAELAKDMAAFANAHGGVILVGAYEDRGRGILGKFQGFEAEEAKQVRDAYSRAAKDYCSPSPVNDSKLIEHPTGKIVAVNVWPFPGQAVGVRGESDSWTFPWRSGIDTAFLRPEHLPMLMLAELRRKVALLRSIRPDEKVTIDDGTRYERYLVEVNENENYTKLAAQPPGASNSYDHIALERIERVWKSTDGWEVHVGPRTRR